MDDLSPIITIISTSLYLDTKQGNYMIESLKYYRKLRKEKRANTVQYEVFPAIAFSERVVQEASTSLDKVFRQGLLVKTEDTNGYYYIGGYPYLSL